MSVVSTLVGPIASWTRLVRILTSGIAGLALLQGGPVAAQRSNVDFKVSGTSTIRGWTCTVTGTAQVTAGSSTPVRGLDGGVQTATLSVPVDDFICP